MIKEIELYGQKCTIDEFLLLLKTMPAEQKENLIYSIFVNCGPFSKEFIFVIQGLCLWCIRRYTKGTFEVDEDLFYDSILKVLEEITRFDVTKGKLTSFVHTLVRGEVTKWLCRKVKEKLVDHFDDSSLHQLPAETPPLSDGYSSVYLRREAWNYFKNTLKG